MAHPKPLLPQQLYRTCDPELFTFKTTAELEDLAETIGQSRAMGAVRFGVGIRRKGYNLFALGPNGIGKRSTVEHFLAGLAPNEPVPSDWCYVNNFQQPHKPRVLCLPPGWGLRLKRDMEKLVDDLRALLPVAFTSDDYQIRRSAIEEEAKSRYQAAITAIEQKAAARDIALLRTPSGIEFAPMGEGEVMEPGEFAKLADDERARVERDMDMLHGELAEVSRWLPRRNREAREKIKTLQQEVAADTVRHLEEDLRQTYAGFPEVLAFLDAAQQDLIDNIDNFLRRNEVAAGGAAGLPSDGFALGPRASSRYDVNLLVDHGHSQGAPVIYEANPTFQNLLGQVGHVAQPGALVTDFNMIKPGAFHRANGGYLIIDARSVFLQPSAWEGLKRALQSTQIRIESPDHTPSAVASAALEPDPIPLNIKVILLGDSDLYYPLYEHDPDFRELFKVLVDFTTELDRGRENDVLYARLIATQVRREKLRHLDAAAVARVIEYGARVVGDAEKVSASVAQITDLLVEADYWAGESANDVVRANDVQRALDARVHRADRIREQLQEETLRGMVLINTVGDIVGQVNGLSVIDMGDFSFGRPVRISARVWCGGGEVIDIEREVELAGPLHSKGVLILTGFLGERYADQHALELTASLVFEQSYGEIDGDSASSAELYALLSAIAETPLKQSLAVTGSVDQHGQIQSIGGINEKIEGFFDLCQARGLQDGQGVLIPAANVKHLMLRQDIVQAVAEGRFNIFPVSTVDEGIELLTGVPAGEKDESGNYPAGSVNHRVAERLEAFAEASERRHKDEHEGHSP